MDPTNESEQTNNSVVISNSKDNIDKINTTNMNEETSTSQTTNSSTDTKVNEYLHGISAFIQKMKSSQVGGGNSVVANERAKVAKLFNILSIEELLDQFQMTSSTDLPNTVPQPSETEE